MPEGRERGQRTEQTVNQGVSKPRTENSHSFFILLCRILREELCRIDTDSQPCVPKTGKEAPSFATAARRRGSLSTDARQSGRYDTGQ